MSDPVFLYVTVPDEQTGTTISQKLVSAKLAACTNILPGMTSIYEWEGKLEESTEVVMIVKTTCAAADQARKMIIDAHTYDCPCVIALPVDPSLSHPGFVEWIDQNVS